MKYRALSFLVSFLFLGVACAGTDRMAVSGTPDPVSAMTGGTQAVYHGVLPCADCEGIETVLTLRPDNSYERRTRYLGKADRVETESGSYRLDDGRGLIVVGEGESRTFYRRGAEGLIMMDRAGNLIEGALASHYVLKEKAVPPLKETYWKLVDLMGKPVVPGNRDAYIILKADDMRVTGSGGCNRIMGTYSLGMPDRLRFGKMAATMMACPEGMQDERAFLDMLEKVDSYVIRDGQLYLHRARMAPLARLEAVYLY